MGLIARTADSVDRAAFSAIRALASPNAIFALYVMFATILTGCFVSGVCTAPL